MMIDFNSIGRRLSDLFFPRRCAVCGRITSDGKPICKSCDMAFERKYIRTEADGADIISVCAYNEYSKPIVYGAKNDRDGDKLDFIAAEIADCAAYFEQETEFDYIIPIPMHPSDKLKRGYNQTEKICRELSRISKVPYLAVLKKTRRTENQKRLDRKGRSANLKGCFSVCTGADLSGKKLLIVDDVTTTGATFREILQALEPCGCAKIVCAAFARTVMRE